MFSGPFWGVGAQESVNADITAVLAGQLVDGRGGAPLRDQVILVRGERIEAVGARTSVTVPPGARVVGLSGHIVLPGLRRDTHLTSIPEVVTVGEVLDLLCGTRLPQRAPRGPHLIGP